MNKRVMVIDDELSILSSLEEGLEDVGYSVCTVQSLANAPSEILRFKPQVILLDLRLKDGNGLEFIDEIRTIDDEIRVIIITAYGDIQSAVQAMKAGALEYVTKPFDFEEIEVQLERAFDQYRMNRKIQLIEGVIEKDKSAILTQNLSMKTILEEAKRIASMDDVTVLITGETGTGKELIAEYIFSNSRSNAVPMVRINCASIPKDLFESELYGHEKHAFTGAGKLKKGLLEMADGGIVFLDEVGEIPLEQQAKLLRFLEDKKIKRVGGTVPIEVQVRVVAATNRDLLEMVETGHFRADFYYRLNVVPIKIPPLRERKEDILYLAMHFLGEYNKKFGTQVNGFTEEACAYLENYTWPGNVRELKNMVERMCIVHNQEWIDIDHIPKQTVVKHEKDNDFDFILRIGRGETIDLPGMIEEIEGQCIESAMYHAKGNQSKAADLLCMSRFALKRRLDK